MGGGGGVNIPTKILLKLALPPASLCINILWHKKKKKKKGRLRSEYNIQLYNNGAHRERERINKYTILGGWVYIEKVKEILIL